MFRIAKWDEEMAAKSPFPLRPHTPAQTAEFDQLADEVDQLTDTTGPIISMVVLPQYGEIIKRNPCPHEKGFRRGQCIQCGIEWLREIVIGVTLIQEQIKAEQRGERSFTGLLPN